VCTRAKYANLVAMLLGAANTIQLLLSPGNAVAIKIIKDTNDVKPIKQEVALLRSCQHPGVITFEDFIHESTNYYMILELCEGGELFDRIVSKEAYAEVDARRVIRTLLQVTEHLHGMSIVHRDYKPENLLLKSLYDDSDMRLCDFGLATLASGRNLTEVVGTPGYMAPELLSRTTQHDAWFLEVAYGTEVDLWAVGVLMFVLVEGAAPFYDDDPKLLDEQVKTAKLEFDDEMWEHCHKDAKELVTRLLEKKPEKRITATEALQHSWFAGHTDDDCTGPDHKLGVTLSHLQKLKRDLDTNRMCIDGCQSCKFFDAMRSSGQQKMA